MKAALARLVTSALKSPRTTIAGLAAIAAALAPSKAIVVSGLATGLGLIFAADSGRKPEE